MLTISVGYQKHHDQFGVVGTGWIPIVLVVPTIGFDRLDRGIPNVTAISVVGWIVPRPVTCCLGNRLSDP